MNDDDYRHIDIAASVMSDEEARIIRAQMDEHLKAMEK